MSIVKIGCFRYSTPVPVTFRIEQFEGPLDLLLQLIEQEKLLISTVSLAHVAEQFVQHVEANPNIPPEELADFLVIAAKLMYMKSKLLLPSLVESELEEGPDLETQLREYQRFVQASRRLNEMWMAERRSFPSSEKTYRPETEGCVLPAGVTADALMHVYRRVIARLEPILRLPETSMERVVTIQQKIRDLFHRIKTHAKTSFRAFLSGAKDKTEAVVSFLALLELVKQRFVHVDQKDLFNEIMIQRHPDAPQTDPLAESFV